MLKILVVDDEVSTLRGIATVLRRFPDEFELSGEATSAMQALEILGQANGMVDVVITDVRMPVMSGVQLVRILSQRYPEIHVVVLSAYGDYDYVRACMKYGAVDYLLKPCRYQVLLATLRHIIADKHTLEQERQAEDARSHLRRMLLMGASGAPQPLSFLPALLVCVRQAVGESGALSCLEGLLRYSQPNSNQAPIRHILLNMEDSLILLLDARALKGDHAAFLSSIHQRLAADCRISAMAYALLEDGDQLVDCARECEKFCEFLAFNGVNRLARLDERKSMRACAVATEFSDYWTHARLAALLRLESDDALIEAFGRLEKSFRWPDGYINPTELKREVIRLLFALDQDPACQNNDPEGAIDSCVEYTNRVNKAACPGEMLDILRTCLISLREQHSGAKQMPRYVTEAIEYINSHYMKNLTLHDVAQAVFLNEWYFSSSFKKHLGVSFKEFLNTTRIEAAKRLLREHDLKIGQIAEMVGFSDAAYFATIFKHNTGKTPMEYRRIE